MKQREMLFLVANEGRRVKDPDTMKVIAAEGEWKPATSYWIRRLREDDVRKAEPPPLFKPALEPLPTLSIEEPKPEPKKKRQREQFSSEVKE